MGFAVATAGSIGGNIIGFTRWRELTFILFVCTGTKSVVSGRAVVYTADRCGICIEPSDVHSIHVRRLTNKTRTSLNCVHMPQSLWYKHVRPLLLSLPEMASGTLACISAKQAGYKFLLTPRPAQVLIAPHTCSLMDHHISSLLDLGVKILRSSPRPRAICDKQ